MQNNPILAFHWGDWPRPDPNGPQCGPLVSLSGKNKILVVESPINILSPFIHRKKFFNWLINLGRIERINPQLSVFTPTLFIPYHPRLPLPIWIKKILNKVNNPILGFQIKKILKKQSMLNPTLWLSMLHPPDLIYKYPYKLVCVLCYDEVSYSPIFTKKQQLLIREFEEKLLKKADLVFTTSEMLYNNKIKINPKTYFIPNAVETEFINRINSKESRDVLANIAYPHIGYIGKINIRLDFKLIYTIAQGKPQWQWIFIGPIEFSADKQYINCLKKLNNVHFLGEKPHFEIPDYLKNLHVLTIPFVLNEYTKNMHPLKLYQYLASGKPIVSTNLPSVAMFNKLHPNLVNIALNDFEFIQLIEKSIQETDTKLTKHRMEIALENTWEKRAQLISKIIDENTSHI